MTCPNMARLCSTITPCFTMPFTMPSSLRLTVHWHLLLVGLRDVLKTRWPSALVQYHGDEDPKITWRGRWQGLAEFPAFLNLGLHCHAWRVRHPACSVDPHKYRMEGQARGGSPCGQATVTLPFAMYMYGTVYNTPGWVRRGEVLIMMSFLIRLTCLATLLLFWSVQVLEQQISRDHYCLTKDG